MSECDNCGSHTTRRIGEERLKLLPYPHLTQEMWCPKCYYPKSLNGYSAFLRRHLPVKEQ